jgi:hypothetical protein
MKKAYSRLAETFCRLMENTMPLITAITLADSIKPQNWYRLCHLVCLQMRKSGQHRLKQAALSILVRLDETRHIQCVFFAIETQAFACKPKTR